MRGMEWDLAKAWKSNDLFYVFTSSHVIYHNNFKGKVNHENLPGMYNLVYEGVQPKIYMSNFNGKL